MKASQAKELYIWSAEMIREYSKLNEPGTLNLTCPDFNGGILLSYAPEKRGIGGKGIITSALLYEYDLAGFLPNIYFYSALPEKNLTFSGATGNGDYFFSLSLPGEQSALLRADNRSISIIGNGNPRDLGEILPAFFEKLSEGDAKLRKE